MTNQSARIISFLFNPIFLLAALPFCLLYKVPTDLSLALFWTIYTFIFLFVVSIAMLIAVKKKVFTDLDVSKREQRPLLFGICFIILFLYISGIYILRGPTVLSVVALGSVFGLLLISIINMRVKASLHLATLSALVVPLAVFYRGWYLLLLGLIPLVGWARVKIKRHSVLETIVGGVVGSLLSLLIYFVMKGLYD